jgi:hypothetical protein
MSILERVPVFDDSDNTRHTAMGGGMTCTCSAWIQVITAGDNTHEL